MQGTWLASRVGIRKGGRMRRQGCEAWAGRQHTDMPGEEDRRGGRVPLHSEPDIQLERRRRRSRLWGLTFAAWGSTPGEMKVERGRSAQNSGILKRRGEVLVCPRRQSWSQQLPVQASWVQFISVECPCLLISSSPYMWCQEKMLQGTFPRKAKVLFLI